MHYSPHTRQERDCRKKGSSVYMSVKVCGCLGSHCSTARLADTYRAVAFTPFIALSSTALEKLLLNATEEWANTVRTRIPGEKQNELWSSSQSPECLNTSIV